MKTVHYYFNQIYDAIFNQLEEGDQAIAYYLFQFQNEEYGFDMGENIDEWLNKNHPDHKIELTQKSREIFNSLFKLYHANTHLMLLTNLIKLAPDFGKHYQIMKVSNDPEILDIRKLKPDEPREDLDQQTLFDCCTLNNRRALGIIINHKIPLPIELPYGDTWSAAVKLDKIRHNGFNIAQANLTINNVARKNLEQYEEEQKNISTRNNMIKICEDLFSKKHIEVEEDKSYFLYTFNPDSSKNIDTWLSTHSPYKNDVKLTLLEPETKEILNSFFRLHFANEHLIQMKFLMTEHPDFCKQFKIVRISEKPIIYDIAKKSKNEMDNTLFTSEDIDKYLKKNLNSGIYLTKDTHIALPMAIPITTPKKFNFTYDKLTDDAIQNEVDKTKEIIMSAANENSIATEKTTLKNHQTRLHTSRAPRSE